MKNDSQKLVLDFENPQFLEFYGALLGDGWLSAHSRSDRINSKAWVVGFSGDIKLDENYLARIKRFTKSLFGKEGYYKYRPNYSAMEFRFGFRELIELLNKELGFPIGLKEDLKINPRYLGKWNLMKYVIRGLFDTDGSFYCDKDKRYRTPYPTIDITSDSTKLLGQLASELRGQGFRVIVNKRNIKMKGREQTAKWFKEIEPKNERHLRRYNDFILSNGPVAQSGQSDTL